MPNDARNKLRSMGGIMASSPELMQAAQGYQAGGSVYAGAPIDPVAGRQQDVQRFGISYPQWQSMSRSEREDLGFPVSTIGGQMHFNRFGVGMGLVDRGTRFNPYGEAPYQINQVVPDTQRDMEPPIDEFLAPSEMSRLPTVNVGNVPYLYDPATQRVFRQDGSAVTPEEQATAQRIISQSPEAQTQINAPQMASEQLLERNEALAQSRLEEVLRTGTDEEITEARSDVKEAQAARTAPQKPAPPAETETLPQRDRTGADAGNKPEPRPLEDLRVPEELLDRVRESVEQDPRLSPDPSADADTGDGDNDGNGGPPPPPPEPTKKDLRSRYKEKIELFKEIYGEDDEDRARDKAMSLAMLGLAVASGQSPNALTNIAQGAMAGVQGMSEQERARREQEQGLRTLALESAMGEMDAEREAQARMAEAKYDRDTRLAVARAGSGAGYGTRTDPATAYTRIRGDLSKSTEFMGADSNTLDLAAYEQLRNTYGNIPYVAELGRRLGVGQVEPVVSPEDIEAETKKLLGED